MLDVLTPPAPIARQARFAMGPFDLIPYQWPKVWWDYADGYWEELLEPRRAHALEVRFGKLGDRWYRNDNHVDSVTVTEPTPNSILIDTQGAAKATFLRRGVGPARARPRLPRPAAVRRPCFATDIPRDRLRRERRCSEVPGRR